MDLGAHCSLYGQLDFAPFRCDGCSALFCKEHRPTGVCAHGDARAPPLPGPAPRAYAHACALCAHAVAVRTACPLCQLVFCLPHRDPAAHSCVGGGGGSGVAAPSARRAAAISPMDGVPAVAAAGGGGGASALQAKVALMQLRMRTPAPAGVAQGDRRWLFIAVDDAVVSAGLAAPRMGAAPGVCVSQHASAARLLDAVVAAVGAPGSAAAALALAVRRGAVAPLPLPPDARLSDGAALAAAGGALADGDTVVLQRR